MPFGSILHDRFLAERGGAALHCTALRYAPLAARHVPRAAAHRPSSVLGVRRVALGLLSRGAVARSTGQQSH